MAKRPTLLRSMSATRSHPQPATHHEFIGDLPVVSASEVKNRFGEIATRALKGALAIQRHQRTELVLMPMEEYVALRKGRLASLDDLSSRFDAMVARMNTPAAKRGAKGLFNASPAALGKSAVKAARAHGA